MKNIMINNRLESVPDEIINLSQLLEFLKIPESGTATAINNKIVIAKNRKTVLLNDNDSVTIISAAYGG